MADINKAAYVEVLETIWRPHRDAPSLLGEGWCGSTLGEACQQSRMQERNQKWNDRRRERMLTQSAKRDFAYYEGQ